jgi:sporulation protein YlmC with PRC-barrel domain
LGTTGFWGGGMYPGRLYGVAPDLEESSDPKGDPHLRSVKEIVGYHIQAQDGEMGHVEDFVIEDATWKIRHMVVDTRNWLPSPKVIVSPDWIAAVRWDARKVSVSLSKEEVRDAPRYDPRAPVNREYEVSLYDYYGRPRYW